MTKGISLRFYDVDAVPSPQLTGGSWRVRVEAYDGREMPDEIFVHRRITIDGQRGIDAEDYVHVASPVQLGSLPVGEPIPGEWPGYYRKNVIDLFVESLSDADVFVAKLRKRVPELVQALNLLDNLVVTEEVRIGAPSVSDSSSSV